VRQEQEAARKGRSNAKTNVPTKEKNNRQSAWIFEANGFKNWPTSAKSAPQQRPRKGIVLPKY
jgi:hypothetical protein